jgi:hypothetical protein
MSLFERVILGFLCFHLFNKFHDTVRRNVIGNGIPYTLITLDLSVELHALLTHKHRIRALTVKMDRCL